MRGWERDAPSLVRHSRPIADDQKNRRQPEFARMNMLILAAKQQELSAIKD
jgi:hypothetical protein